MMKSFGLVIDWVSSPYYQDIWKGIRAGFQERGANLLTLVTDRMGSPGPGEGRLDQLLLRVAEAPFDGFVVLTAPLAGRLSPPLMKRLWDGLSRKPVVSLGFPFGTAPTLIVRHEPGFVQILEHLWGVHGHRRFAYAGGPRSNPDALERSRLFTRFLEHKGLECPPRLIAEVEFSLSGGRDAADQLVPGDLPDFEVLVCASDDIALGALETLSRKGVRIPEDLALTGYDDVNLAGMVSLTTASQSLFELGHRASEILWDLAVEGKPFEGTAETDSVLVTRSTCGCPAGEQEGQSLAESRLRLVQSTIRHRLSHDQLSRLTDLLVRAQNPRDQQALLEQFLPGIGVRRFQLSMKDGGNAEREFGPEPWSFVEETLYDQDTNLGTLLMDLGEDAEMLTLVAEIAERVARGVETVHRIHRLEVQVAQRTAELREMALRDELTGLYNRRGFLTLAEHELRAHQRTGDSLVLFYADLDGLKSVNDTWGHDAGDEAIRTTARILVESLRTEDLVARMGGDEFVMLAARFTLEDATGLNSRLTNALAQESGGRYGMSLGWILVDPKEKKPLEQWLVLADQALYRAKQSRKNQAAPKGTHPEL